MKKYRQLARDLIAVQRSASSNFLARRILEAAPLVVLFLVLNTRVARAACSFSPAPDPTLDGSSDSLRHAIRMANASGEDCTIELQAGTYTLTIRNTHGQENAAAEGDLDITSSGHTVTIDGKGAEVSIVNGNDIDRVFHVLGGANAVFANLTIKGGVARDNGSSGAQRGKSEATGGGVLVQGGGYARFSHVSVGGNWAIGGPGVKGNNGTPGEAAAGGGVFLSAGTVDLTRSKIIGNVAIGGTGGTGTTFGGSGGLGAGAGLYVYRGTAKLLTSSISGNKVQGGHGGLGGFGTGGGRNTGNGGAAQGAGLFVGGGTLLISRTTVSGNSALGGTATGSGTSGFAQGAGLLVGGGIVSVINATLSGNAASYGPCFSTGSGFSSCGDALGGGLYVSNGSVSLAGTTIASNHAIQNNMGFSPGSTSGGGIGNVGAKSLVANATLIGDNTSDSGVYSGDDVSGPITISYSLIGQSADALITNDGGNIFDLDPMLDPTGLKFNGGPTRNRRVGEGQPGDRFGS